MMMKVIQLRRNVSAFYLQWARMSGVVWLIVKPTYHSSVEWLIADVRDVSTLHQLSVFHAWVIVRLTLRYTTPDMHCRDRRYECDGGIKFNNHKVRPSVWNHTERLVSLALLRQDRNHLRLSLLFFGCSHCRQISCQSVHGWCYGVLTRQILPFSMLSRLYNSVNANVLLWRTVYTAH